MDKIISVKNLSKSFKVKKSSGRLLKDLFKPDYKVVNAVNSISFQIAPGESVAFLGPNGAGKTTTTKMLSGLLYPSKGEISVMGFTPFDRKKEFLMEIGLVMGNKSGLNWDLTPRQSFELLKRIYRISDKDYKERVEYLLEMLSVNDVFNTQVRKLSLGQRMKMELIASILHNPKVLFLDEPTIGLDISSKQLVREFLRKIQRDYGTTLILTSHDMDDVERVCERVLIISQGSIILDESLHVLTERYRKDRFVRVIFEGEKYKENFLKVVGDKFRVSDSSVNDVTVQLSKNELSLFLSLSLEQEGFNDVDIISTPLEEIIADVFAHGSDSK